MDSPFQEESFNEFVAEEDKQEIDNDEGGEEEEDVEEEKEEEEIKEKEEEMEEQKEEEREIEADEIQGEKEEESGEETKEDECDEKKEEEKEKNEQNEENEIMDSFENKNEEKKEDECQTLKELGKKECVEDHQGKEDVVKYEISGHENETTSTAKIKSLYANELKKEEKPSETKQTVVSEKKEKCIKKSKLLYGCDYMRTTLSRLEVNLPKYINKIVKLGKPKEKEEKTEEECTIEPFEKTKEITKITSENIPLVYPILKKKHVPVILSKKVSAIDEETCNMYKQDDPDYKPYIVPIEVYVPKYLNPEVGYEYMNYEIKDKDIDMEVKTKLLEQLNPHLMFYDYYKCDPYRILSDYYNLASLLFKGKAIMKEPNEIPQRLRQPKSMQVFYRRIKIVKKKVSV